MFNVKSFKATKEFQDYKARVEKATQEFFDKLAGDTRACAHGILLGLFEGEEPTKKQVRRAARKVTKATTKVTKRVMKRTGKVKKASTKDASKAFYLRTKLKADKKISAADRKWLDAYTTNHTSKATKKVK